MKQTNHREISYNKNRIKFQEAQHNLVTANHMRLTPYRLLNPNEIPYDFIRPIYKEALTLRYIFI